MAKTKSKVIFFLLFLLLLSFLHSGVWVSVCVCVSLAQMLIYRENNTNNSFNVKVPSGICRIFFYEDCSANFLREEMFFRIPFEMIGG